jgi:alpha-amylase/alpha-mannosidase (GH57 family)
MGQIEISCSPLYHPILPLLCNSESVLEAMPNAILPKPQYKYPQDANAQIARGLDYYYGLFGSKAQGMWPSEGSVSNEALSLMANNKILWVATDEGILSASMKDYKSTYKYFPHDIETPNGTLIMFFRDHTLSDKIGFIYSNWEFAGDAADDFKNALIDIRNQIIAEHSEDALDSAVVPIILDGENCWEFYYENGIYFLREFFEMLNTAEEIETVLFSECLNLVRQPFLPRLVSVRSGSWINADFSIWAGHNDDIQGWNLLSEVRNLVENADLSDEKRQTIMKEIYILEGSDWFWWYGPEHNAPNKNDFDIMFRWRIGEVYKMLGINPPSKLNIPINSDNVSDASYSTMHKWGE